MGKSLFIGNGLNLTTNNGISWEKLLNEIANTYKIIFNKNNSFPLEYEKLINNILQHDSSKAIAIYNETKKYVANEIFKMEISPDDIHYRLKELSFDNILTTNYDLNLEKVFLENNVFTNIKIDNNKKYLFDKLNINSNINFYHLHGICTHSNTMCLGYEHYAGLLEKIRVNINTKTNKEKSKMIIKQMLCGEKQFEGMWYELFYTSDIYIIGFNLYESEIDIWWLLTHRAYLYYNNYENLKSKIKNKIVFYDIYKTENKVEREKIHDLLFGLHVVVKKYEISDDKEYIIKYNEIIDDIKTNE